MKESTQYFFMLLGTLFGFLSIGHNDFIVRLMFVCIGFWFFVVFLEKHNNEKIASKK